MSHQEDLLLSLPQTEEVSVIYSGGCPARAGRMRRLPFSAKKTGVSSSSISRMSWPSEDLQKGVLQLLRGGYQLSANLQRCGLPQSKGTPIDQLGREEKGIRRFCGPSTRRLPRKPLLCGWPCWMSFESKAFLTCPQEAGP